MRKHFRKSLNLLSVALIGVTVASCGPIYNTTYTFSPPNSMQGRQCVNDCLAQKSHCSFRCQRDYEQCTFAAQDEAHHQYREWQRHHHGDHSRYYNDFVDTSQCQQDCGCDNDYRQCYANCGGAVIPHTRCVAFCNKK